MSRVVRILSILSVCSLLFGATHGLSFSQAGEGLEVRISLAPGPSVRQGEKVDVYVTIKNLIGEPIGGEFDKPITITLRYAGMDENTRLQAGKFAVIEDEEYLPASLDYIRPNEEKTFRAGLDTLKAGTLALPEGAYEISAEVLVIRELTGSILATSFTTTDLEIEPSEIKPDLVLKSVTFSNGSFIDQEVSFFITAKVYNGGTADVKESSRIVFFQRRKGESNLKELDDRELPELERSSPEGSFAQSLLKEYQWDPGVYVIQAWVDYYREIEELEEGNNSQNSTLFVVNHDQMRWAYPCIPITVLDEEGGLEKIECDEAGKIGAIEGGPAVIQAEQDRLIYFGSDDGHLYVVRSSGSYVDRYPRSGAIGAVKATPAEFRGTVYFGSADGHLYALDAARQKRWQYPAEGEEPLGPLWASPAITTVREGETEKTLIYCGSDDGNLYVIEDQGDSAALRWTFSTGAFIRSTPAIITVTENGFQRRLIYFGSGDGNFYALEDQGDKAGLRWTFPTGSFIKSSPKIFNQTVYFGSSDGHLYALFLDGTRKWQYPRTDERPIGAVESTPVIGEEGDETVIYFGANDGSLYKLEEDPEGEMSEGWRFNEYDARPLGPIRSSPVRRAVGEEWLIYFGSDDGTLYAVDSSGDIEWAFPTRGAISGAPAIAGNNLYITSWEGELYALRPEQAD